MKWLNKIRRNKKAIVGLEAAIVLIAFVIIAAAFSFMVVNQGLFATERGKAVVQEGLQQASTPLSMDGTVFLRIAANSFDVTVIVVPLRAYGVDFVAMWNNETVVTLKIGDNAWGNIYGGVLYMYNGSVQGTYDPTDKKFDDFVGLTKQGSTYTNNTYGNWPASPVAALAIENSNDDEALNSDEKGYMIINLGSNSDYLAEVREKVVVEIRLEKTAPLTIEFNVPESMDKDHWITQ